MKMCKLVMSRTLANGDGFLTGLVYCGVVRYPAGKVSLLKVLSASEIQQNFNALRGRFGI